MNITTVFAFMTVSPHSSLPAAGGPMFLAQMDLLPNCLLVCQVAVPADVPMWEFGGHHLYTNSSLHHSSAFYLGLMGSHPGHSSSSKSDLEISFLIHFSHPCLFLSIIFSCPRSSTHVYLFLFFFPPTFLLMLFLLLLISPLE